MNSFHKARYFIGVFNDLALVRNLSNNDLSELFVFLRAANLLGIFAYKVIDQELLQVLPRNFQNHVISNINYFERQSFHVGNEVSRIDSILKKVDIKAVFLKGAAYNLEGISSLRGRTMSDIDILVSSNKLVATEQRLKTLGWQLKDVTEYDDKYYRKFAHEIPPMFDPVSGTILDIHHNLYLPVSGRAPDEKILLQHKTALGSGVFVLSRHMQALHTCVHLYWNEDVSSSLRDLYDFTCLCRVDATDNFWRDIINTSEKMGLSHLLFDVLCMAEYFFYLKYPVDIKRKLYGRHYSGRLNLRRKWVQYFMKRALIPDTRVCSSTSLSIFRFAAYIRGHFLKMPLTILFPHLVKKAWLHLMPH